MVLQLLFISEGAFVIDQPGPELVMWKWNRYVCFSPALPGQVIERLRQKWSTQKNDENDYQHLRVYIISAKSVELNAQSNCDLLLDESMISWMSVRSLNVESGFWVHKEISWGPKEYTQTRTILTKLCRTTSGAFDGIREMYVYTSLAALQCEYSKVLKNSRRGGKSLIRHA